SRGVRERREPLLHEGSFGVCSAGPTLGRRRVEGIGFVCRRQDASCTCRQCSYMRFTTANTNAVDHPTSSIPVRPSIPASTRQPGPRTTSPKPIVVYVTSEKY